jgi:hypothetical protein
MSIDSRNRIVFFKAGLACCLFIAASSQAIDLPRPPSLPKAELVPARELTEKFDGLAGPSENSDRLVRGLRTGKPVTLSEGSTHTRLHSPSGPMGYGSINISLSLAQAELNGLGIRHPTPSQLQAALNGGTVMTPKGATSLPGVLTLRSHGKGWGQIAHQLGFKLGEVVRPTRWDTAQREKHEHERSAKHASHHEGSKHDGGPGNHAVNDRDGGFDRPHGSDRGMGGGSHKGK